MLIVELNVTARRRSPWQAVGAAALLAVAPASTLAQSNGERIWLQVVDSATGRPLPNVGETTAATASPTTFLSHERTDSAGRVSYIVPRGSSLILELYCPTIWNGLTNPERIIFSRVVRADTAVDTLQTVALTIDRVLCAEPPIETRVGEFWGHYETGFEVSVFISCVPLGDLSHTDYSFHSRVASVEAFDSTANEAFIRLAYHRGHSVNDAKTYYVRWSGTLTGPGPYGPGAYRLVVDHVAEVRTPRSNDCVDPGH